jgi:SAM-dependent methyltransferase
MEKNKSIQAFVDLVKGKKGLKVLEVGCWMGDTTKEWAPIVHENGGEALVVDWFAGNKDTQVDPNIKFQPENKDNNYEKFLDNIGPCKDYVTVHIGDSVEMSTKIEDESMDIIFIDANHTYNGVKRDIESYLPKVKKGGILCGHDSEAVLFERTLWVYTRWGWRCLSDDTVPINAVEESLLGDVKRLIDMDGSGITIDYWAGSHPGVTKAVWDCLTSKVPRYNGTGLGRRLIAGHLTNPSLSFGPECRLYIYDNNDRLSMEIIPDLGVHGIPIWIYHNE